MPASACRSPSGWSRLWEEIGVTPNAGEGSTVWFELPVELVHHTVVRAQDDLSAASVLLVGHDRRVTAAPKSALGRGGLTRITWTRDPEGIPAPPVARRFDRVILAGRRGVPSVVEWEGSSARPQRLSTEPVGPGATHGVVVAAADPADRLGAVPLGTMTVPARSRRLYPATRVVLMAQRALAVEDQPREGFGEFRDPPDGGCLGQLCSSFCQPELTADLTAPTPSCCTLSSEMIHGCRIVPFRRRPRAASHFLDQTIRDA